MHTSHAHTSLISGHPLISRSLLRNLTFIPTSGVCYQTSQLVFGPTLCISPPPVSLHTLFTHTYDTAYLPLQLLFLNHLTLNIKVLQSFAISENMYPKIQFHHYRNVYMAREPNGAHVGGNDSQSRPCAYNYTQG